MFKRLSRRAKKAPVGKAKGPATPQEKLVLDAQAIGRQSMALKKTAPIVENNTVIANASNYAPKDLAPLAQVFKSCKGNMAKVKKHKRFKGVKWADNFAPKSETDFAVGVLGGRAFKA